MGYGGGGGRGGVGWGLTLFGLGGCGGADVGCDESRELRARSSPFDIYPAAKLQWHFTCGFDFRHSLWLPFAVAFAVLKGLLIVPVGTIGPFFTWG